MKGRKELEERITLKDIFYLADILGHSNVNTTRIYTVTTGENHRRRLQSLGLIG